jgi:hypothetical protein
MLYEGGNYSSVAYIHNTLEDSEDGFGGEIGFHIMVANHFGITFDGAFAIPGYQATSNTFHLPNGGTYVTNSSKSSGMYFYAMVGLQYGIW